MKTALALFMKDGHRPEDWPLLDQSVRNHYLLLAARLEPERRDDLHGERKRVDVAQLGDL